MRSARRQRGLAGAAVLVLVILALLAVALGRGAFSDEEAGLDQRGVTTARMTKITEALVAFSALNGRLPCPAPGTLDAGDASPLTATTACTDADGVVPWKSIALRREDALDGWGRKISYRVFGGTAGFTLADGVNMTNCNSSLGYALDATLASGELCKPGTPPPNMPAQFYDARGNMLVVEDAGTTRNGNAFVLVSHGDSGYGAFPADGASGRTTLPNNTGREFTNTQATGTYWILSRSAPGTPATDAGHFDDVVAYMSAREFIARAKLGARAWSLSAEYTLPAVTAAAPGLSGEDTGQAYLGIGGILVIATDSSPGARNVGIRTEDGITGIGVVGGGAPAGDLNSVFGERLSFIFGKESQLQKLDVAFNRFRVVQTSPPRLEERAEVSFWRDRDLLQTSILTSWVEDVKPARCLFGLVSSAVFDRADVRPISRTGDGGQTTFTVAAVQACPETAGTCATAVATAVDCPGRPPSASATTAADIRETTATLKGFADDNDVATTVSFDYGTTCSYPSSIAASPASLAAGTGNKGVTADLTGLTCNTSYYFRTRATSTGGTTTGNDAMFTTEACASPMPIATTGAATAITTTTAALNGIATDNGADTTVTFDIGFSNCYGFSVMATPGVVASGTGATPVSAALTGLLCDSRYHYRLRAESSAGTTTSPDMAFTTAPCP